MSHPGHSVVSSLSGRASISTGLSPSFRNRPGSVSGPEATSTKPAGNFSDGGDIAVLYQIRGIVVKRNEPQSRRVVGRFVEECNEPTHHFICFDAGGQHR